MTFLIPRRSTRCLPGVGVAHKRAAARTSDAAPVCFIPALSFRGGWDFPDMDD